MRVSIPLSLSAVVLIASLGAVSAMAQRTPTDVQSGARQPSLPGATKAAAPNPAPPGGAGIQPAGGGRVAPLPGGGGQPPDMGGLVGGSSIPPGPGTGVGGTHAPAGGFAGAPQCAPGFQQTASGGVGPGSQGITFTCQMPQPMNCPDKSAMRKNGNPATGQGVRVVFATTGGADTHTLHGTAASSSFRVKYICEYHWHQG